MLRGFCLGQIIAQSIENEQFLSNPIIGIYRK